MSREDTPMRVALFARYSSKMQDEASIDAQLAEMEAHCSKQGWEVTHRFLLPEVRSSEIEESPEFAAMLDAAGRREFDLLLLHKLDRFGRDRETAVKYKALLRRKGIQVRSVVENLGDSITDRLVEAVLEGVSEWYARNLAEETRKGHRQLVRRGYFKGGSIPFGLALKDVVEGETTHRAYIAHPENGPIMIEVFRRLAEGHRTTDILDWLKEQTGERWTLPTYYTRVRNPIYYGRIEYGRSRMQAGHKRQKLDPSEIVVGEWAGLVSKDLWDLAQAALGSRGRSGHNTRPLRVYLLSDGVAVCQACGRNLVGCRFHEQSYYVCAGRRDKKCTTKAVPAEKLEDLILGSVIHKCRNWQLDEIVLAWEAGMEAERAASRAREVRLRKQLGELGARKRNLLDLVERGGADCVPDIVSRLKELSSEESETAELIAHCQLEADQRVREDIALMVDWVAELPDRLELAASKSMQDLKGIYQVFFRLLWDLENRRGMLQMKHPSSFVESVGLSDSSRIRSGRSARI